jgi:Mg-chelatase subunit ChlD
MLRLKTGFLFFLCSASLQAQLVLEKNEHNFGTLLRSSQNWVDLPITNNDQKEALIFRIELEDGFEAKFSSKKIMPGNTEFIRVSYTPRQEGPFSFKLPLYASSWSEPQMVRIKGESTFAESGIIPCPAFGESSSLRIVNFAVEVINADALPIENAEVIFEPGAGEKVSLKTNEYGQVTQGLAYGPYSVSIIKEDVRFDTIMQINAVNDILFVSLDYTEPSLPAQADQNRAIEEIEPVTAEVIESSSAQTENPTEEYPDFSLSEYKPNNLVFLVDVSTSMKQDGKLDLLKSSMIDLLDLLRPVDRFALISYSSDTHVLIETQSNLDKSACVEAIRSLEAGGNTAGARAVKKAREVALKQFIENGNNEVFLATDGAFNEGVEKALKESRKMDRNDVRLSVLGIKCGPFTTKQMKQLVSEGNGGFIPVVSEGEAGDQLIRQVKTNSAYH